MKNLRNLMAWITLAVVLTMGALSVSANTGVLLADRSENPCTTDTKIDLGGILMSIIGVVVHRDGVVVHRDGVVVHRVCEQSRDGVVVH